MYYYSAKTNGFYRKDVHGENIPSDAKQITDAAHQMLMKGQSEGKRIVHDANGGPALAEQESPTQSQLSDFIRAKRDQHLVASDFSQLPDAPGDKSAWAAYRQALRDVPEQVGFPNSVIWPEKPKN